MACAAILEMRSRQGQLLLFLMFFSMHFCAMGQGFFEMAEEKSKGRVFGVGITQGALYAGSLVLLGEAWYSDHDRSSFHTFDDSGEWLQVDKVGHMYSAYTLARLNYGMYRWAGMDEKKSMWIGSAVSFGYLTAIEIMDGHSTNWGFSWSDMAANVIGNGLFIGQQLAWHEQRVLMKFSAHLTDYAEQRPEVLGSDLGERILKDYNGQTYWLSANPSSFRKDRNGPFSWLNIAFGYGAEGMLGANNNSDLEGEISGATDVERYRQYYLSLDIDLSRIKTNSGFLKGLFYVLNSIKVPAPTLEINSKGDTEFHLLYF